jgi:outer membrane receptor for ferrienterochelin and colicins
LLKKFVTLFLILMVSGVTAGELTGKVTSQINGAPLIGANVMLAGTQLGAATDYRGQFRISDIPAGEYEIEVQYIGCTADKKYTVNITGNEVVQLPIILRQEILKGDDIVVTGTRTPRLVKDSPVCTEVILADDIRMMGAENVGEVLEERAGIVITQDGARGGLMSAQLQGLNDNHTLILIDGAPVIGRIAGKLDLSRVSVQNIDRIEIVKGAASALYGSDAVGGVVNIITRNADQPLDYRLDASYGTFNARDIKAEAESKFDENSLLISAEHHSADGYDLDPTTSTTTADATNNYTLFTKYRHIFNEDYELQFSGEYFDQQQDGIDGGRRLTDTRSWYGNIESTWKLANQSSLRGKIYLTAYDKDIDREDMHVRNKEQLLRLETMYSRVLANHIVSIGAEFTDSRLNTNRIADGKKYINNYSFYAQDEIFYKSVEFQLGARADYHSQFDFYLSPKIGMLYKPTENWRFRASYSMGFRAPDFVEMFLVLDHSSLTSQSYVALGNPGLRPETSKSINVGTEYHFSKKAIIRLNLFRNTLNDMINSKLLYTTADGVQYYTYDNLSRATTQGSELDMYISPWDWLRFSAGYAFTEALDIDTDEPLYNRPRHSARFKIDWRFEQAGFSGNVRWRYIGDRKFVDYKGNTTTAPWYATWHTRVEQRIYKPLSLFAGVENIFDYQNREFVALPGRLIYFGLTID